jgi:hypothetical protein
MVPLWSIPKFPLGLHDPPRVIENGRSFLNPSGFLLVAVMWRVLMYDVENTHLY